jgi:hypothetical protein
MSPVRSSALVLWLKYINREPHVAGMVVGLLFGGMLSTPFGLAFLSQRSFLLDGETVEGKVVAKQQALRPGAAPAWAMTGLFAHGGRGPKFYLRYEFVDAAGNRHVADGRAPFAVWTAARPGDAIAIRYVRSDPARSRLESTVWDSWPAVPVAALGGVILAASLWYGTKGIRWVKRQVWLIRHGDALPGRITHAGIEWRGKRRREAITVLEYLYAAPQPVTGKLEMRGKLRPNWQTGRVILILADPNDPTRHAPDLYDARRQDRELLVGL